MKFNVNNIVQHGHARKESFSWLAWETVLCLLFIGIIPLRETLCFIASSSKWTDEQHHHHHQHDILRTLRVVAGWKHPVSASAVLVCWGPKDTEHCQHYVLNALERFTRGTNVRLRRDTKGRQTRSGPEMGSERQKWAGNRRKRGRRKEEWRAAVANAG